MSTEEKTVEAKDMVTGKLGNRGQTKFSINMLIYPAVILHPSLGCPLIVEEQGPVSLIIVTDSTFRQAFLDDNGGQREKYATGGLRVATSIRQHLKLVAWDQARELKQNLSQEDQPLKVADRDIVCTYLGKLDREIKNAQGKHIANIRQSVLNQLYAFREKGEERGAVGKAIDKYFSNNGLRYLFQIDLHNLALQSGALYDSYWVLENHAPQKADVQKKYLDIQDRIAREYIQKSYYSYAGKEGPEDAFKVSANGVELTPDPHTPIMTHHPIWVAPQGKAKLNIGHLSDVHVSSKQAAYKGKGATVIPGAAASVSPPIGDMANNNADNFFDLLSQFGKDANTDVVVITGDLYDHLHNYDAAKLEGNRTGKLWEAMYVDSMESVHARNEEFPCGIDGLIVYSILMDFYTRHKKPVFITSGNHEAYEYPYGISPRVGGGKVNEGIPLDHNLTIYEAILLYGPGYKEVIPSTTTSGAATFTGGHLGRMNFKPQNFDWFYNLFTPLTDFVINHRDMCMVGLGWGDGEEFVWNASVYPRFSYGGSLPRATESANNSQLAMKENHIRLGQTALTSYAISILFSHFTQVNYDLAHPLTAQGEINCNDTLKEYSDFDHGSVKAGRPELYGEWIAQKHFTYTLSGHSHRVGLYRCVKYDNLLGRRTMTVAGGHPEKENVQKAPWRNGTKLLVSASTGPIPKQNHEGEMSGQGMEKPSGSRISFNGGENITLVKSGRDAAKPRFCVACDYIDLLGKGFWEYFKAVDSNGTFEMKPHWEKIHPSLDEQAKRTLIESVTLYMVGDGGTTSTKASIVKAPNGVVDLSGDALRWKIGNIAAKIEFHGESFCAMFLSIKFNGGSLEQTLFGHYNFDSPWNIQVGIYGSGVEIFGKQKKTPNPIGRVAQEMQHKAALNKPSTWQIMRHKKHGEVPDHKARAKDCPQEYGYKLN
jgi:uncharacterized protein YxjI